MLLLLVAEAVVTPAAGLWLSWFPQRCRTPAEAVLTVGIFAGLQSEAKHLGYEPVGRSRAANWAFSIIQARRSLWLTRAGTWAAAGLLLALLLRTRVVGRLGVSLWCAAGAWFFGEKLLTLPLDKEAVQMGAAAVVIVAAHSLVGLAAYGGAIFFLIPLSKHQRRTALKCGLLFSLAVLVYNANLKPLGTGDTFAAPYVAVSLVREGDFDLDEFTWARGGHTSIDPQSNGAVQKRGRIVSKYPPMSSLLAAPFFAVFFFVPWLGTPDNEFLLMQIGKLAATVFAGLSVVCVYLAVRWTRPRCAALVACAYAFGTCTWFVSQSLWQHSACEMALALALCSLILARRDHRFLVLAGFALALALAARHASVAIVATLGAYALWQHRTHWRGLAAGALPVAAFQLAYNWRYFGSPFMSGYQSEAWQCWGTPLAVGLVGHLIGPSRGLLVYSPFLAFASVGVWAAWKERRELPLARLVLASSLAVCAHVVVLSKWSPWHGGLSYGYRMVVEVSPLLALVLAYGLDRIWRSKAARTALLLSAFLSVGVQLVGIMGFDGQWEMWLGGRPDQHRTLRHSQIAFYLERNRWYFVTLRHKPWMHLHQVGWQMTVDGVFKDESTDYPRAYLFENIRRRPE